MMSGGVGALLLMLHRSHSRAGAPIGAYLLCTIAELALLVSLHNPGTLGRSASTSRGSRQYSILLRSCCVDVCLVRMSQWLTGIAVSRRAAVLIHLMRIGMILRPGSRRYIVAREAS